MSNDTNTTFYCPQCYKEISNKDIIYRCTYCALSWIRICGQFRSCCQDIPAAGKTLFPLTYPELEKGKGGRTLNIGEILAAWIKHHGYDGLCNPGLECGCLLDELAPCDGPSMGCTPGYLKSREYEEYDFVMVLKKEEIDD